MTAKHAAIVIGTSAGAVEALSRLLPLFPATFALPIFVVMHLPADKKSIMADLMRDRCALRVREAEDKEPIEAGCVYFAPPDYHMLIEHNNVISLSVEDPVMFSRPSIDVLFESAADIYADRLIGVVLTGANSDGAKGLRTLSNAGGVAIVQDPRQAAATAMPEAALKACPEAHMLALDDIALFIMNGTKQ